MITNPTPAAAVLDVSPRSYAWTDRLQEPFVYQANFLRWLREAYNSSYPLRFSISRTTQSPRFTPRAYSRRASLLASA